jgi:tight adherence protein C
MLTSFLGLTAAHTLIAVLVGTFALLAAAVLALLPAPQRPAARLARYGVGPTRGSPGLSVETLGAQERLLTPLLRGVFARLARLAPRQARRSAASQLVMAGSRMSPTTFLALGVVSQFGLPLVVLSQILTARPVGLMHWAMLGVSLLLGRRLPGIWLKRRIRARQRAIDRSLPYALDLLVACLEGGLSLDASLAKVTEQGDGPLAEEIRLTLQEISLGRPSAEAMKALGERTGAPDLKRLTTNVVQAEQMGIGITEAMRTLAQESRVRRRQRAEEMARKAPIKMVPVLIFVVLPSLIIVVMGPAVLTLMKIFAEQTPS